MAGASNYPAVIDLDAQLLRVDESDVIIPAQHNNLVDAIQSVEQTLGRAGDGSENSGSAEFNCGVATLAGLVSTRMPNVRHPWTPDHARSWYTLNGSPPANWTLDAAVTPDYSKPYGVARLTVDANHDGDVFKVALPADGTREVITRWRLQGNMANPPDGYIGFSASGSKGDQYGMYFGAGIEGSLIGSPVYDGNIPQRALSVYAPWYFMRFKYTGGNFSLWLSADGHCWGSAAYTHAEGVAPAYFGLWIETASVDPTPLWVDFVAYGTTDPAQE